jgi:phenylalanyl-tRNA synthetase beta chain
MATFTFDIKDFNKLVGKNLSIEFLREKLPLMGLEWDSDSGDEITADIFPNRPDMLCVEGLARAFSGFIGLKKGLPDYRVEKSGLKVRVDSKVKKARPFIVCAVVRG